LPWERIAALPEDDWRKRSAHFREPALTSNLRLVETLRAIGQRYNSTPGAVAIRLDVAESGGHRGNCNCSAGRRRSIVGSPVTSLFFAPDLTEEF
jgi:hypothetical protein